MSANTFPVTDTSWETDVEKSEGLVLVDFWAEWCGPCKQVAPVLDEIASENTGKIKIGKLDVDSNQDTAMKFGVMSIPTMILFKDGEPVERLVGYMPKARLMQKLTPHLGSAILSTTVKNIGASLSSATDKQQSTTGNEQATATNE